MLKFLKREANMTTTENGAAAYASTGSECLDLFAAIGALRDSREKEIIKRFTRAYTESPDTAMKLLFFSRDIRGGLGERRVFRVILHWLAENEPASVQKNLAYIAEYGRYDDLLCLLGTPCEKATIALLKAQFEADLNALANGGSVSLLGKWLPSVNTSSSQSVRQAKVLAKAFGLNEASYRKALSALRARIDIIENRLRTGDYTFDYEKQPSRALFKYRAAFYRHDEARYFDFLNRVETGDAVLHADNVSPYELVAPYLDMDAFDCGNSFMRDLSAEEKRALNATWASLPDFGSSENALAVVDTSASMYCGRSHLPAAVALSLGLYFAEHNTGLFHNHFIEFSSRPRLIELKGETFADRLRYAASFNEVANTNLEAVFDLILRTAVKNHVSQKDLPAKLVIISDMEFDFCIDHAAETNFQNAKRKYAQYGYTLPQIAFWNVASRAEHQPVTQNEQGVALVSGASPRIFSMVAGGFLSPYAFMMQVLGDERYAKIAA